MFLSSPLLFTVELCEPIDAMHERRSMEKKNQFQLGRGFLFSVFFFFYFFIPLIVGFSVTREMISAYDCNCIYNPSFIFLLWRFDVCDPVPKQQKERPILFIVLVLPATATICSCGWPTAFSVSVDILCKLKQYSLFRNKAWLTRSNIARTEYIHVQLSSL